MDKESVNVSSEDQERINAFSCLNQKHQSLGASIDALKEDLRKLDDADEEMVVTMHTEDLMMKLGECFVNLTDEEISQRLEKDRAEKKEVLEKLHKQQEEVSEEMGRLKVKLYATFGNSINLEA
eukprot:GHVN01098517.1.p3 GENE.GHVN01098517.1~~GHVN01098517.1.p3  ORF type:complete len:124 (+),score=26.97 GHVN01098517.1:740-1111(+)